MANINEKVKSIVAEQLGVEVGKLNDTSKFVDDLGADSLDIVELVMAFEEEFDCEIPDTDADKIGSLGDAITYLNEKIS
jgi:acyl carrier protein